MQLSIVSCDPANKIIRTLQIDWVDPSAPSECLWWSVQCTWRKESLKEEVLRIQNDHVVPLWSGLRFSEHRQRELSNFSNVRMHEWRHAAMLKQQKFTRCWDVSPSPPYVQARLDGIEKILLEWDGYENKRTTCRCTKSDLSLHKMTVVQGCRQLFKYPEWFQTTRTVCRWERNYPHKWPFVERVWKLRSTTDIRVFQHLCNHPL